MKKWIRRFLYLVAFALIGAIVAAYVSYRLSLATPEWWEKQAWKDEVKLRELTRQAQDKLLLAKQAADDALASENRGRATNPSATGPAGRPNPRTIEFEITGQELNAYFHTWSKLNHWDERIGRHVADPQVVLQDGQLILAGEIRSVEALAGRKVHVHFRPQLDEKGQLHLNLQGVWSGNLPLPSATWESQKHRLVAMLEAQLPALRQRTTLEPSGALNSAGVSAAMGQLLLNILHDRPGEPILFIDARPSSEGGIPVRLTGLKVADKALKLSAVPMTAAERRALVDRIREGKAGAADKPQ